MNLPLKIGLAVTSLACLALGGCATSPTSAGDASESEQTQTSDKPSTTEVPTQTPHPAPPSEPSPSQPPAPTATPTMQAKEVGDELEGPYQVVKDDGIIDSHPHWIDATGNYIGPSLILRGWVTARDPDPERIKQAEQFYQDWIADRPQKEWWATVSKEMDPEYLQSAAQVQRNEITAEPPSGPAVQRSQFQTGPEAAQVAIPVKSGTWVVSFIFSNGRWLVSNMEEAGTIQDLAEE